MARSWINWCGRAALVVLLAACGPALLRADDQPSAGGDAPAGAVDMFPAIKQGDITVKFIPKDSREARLLIENKTDRPLTVKLPDVFGGVPVLGQAAAAGGANKNNNNNQNQGMMGGGGGMGGGGMGGGGMFSIPPEKVTQIKVPTVCLDHGKAEPRPAVPYEIRPIESVTDKAAVWELGRLLGTGQVNQRAAQVAAWHLNNNMSWQQLAAKELRFANGQRQPYFSQQELQAGMQLAAMADRMAEQRQAKADQQRTGSANSDSSSK